MIINENELIYLYQTEKYDWIKNNLFNAYLNKINKLKISIFRRYKKIPLEVDDLNFIAYNTFYKCLLNFKENFNKSFANYLYQRLIWDIHNYIKKFLSKNHVILNYSNPIDENLVGKEEKFLIKSYGNKDRSKRKFLLDNLSSLSKLEKQVFVLKFNGLDYREIENITNLSYKQIDNAVQRSISKIRTNWKKSKFLL